MNLMENLSITKGTHSVDFHIYVNIAKKDTEHSKLEK